MMIHYKLEYLNKVICLRIINYKKIGCSLIFVGIVGFIMFLIPFLAMFFLITEVTFGTILVFALAWFISSYFFRLYLWNRYGEEVFVIKENSLETYNDYKFFKDNRKIHQFTKINILFTFDGKVTCIDHFEKHQLVNDNQLSTFIFRVDDEMIKSHKEIPIAEIMDIAKKISRA